MASFLLPNSIHKELVSQKLFYKTESASHRLVTVKLSRSLLDTTPGLGLGTRGSSLRDGAGCFQCRRTRLFISLSVRHVGFGFVVC